MAQLEPYKQELENLAASLVYIAAEKREGVWNPVKYLEQNPISFPFLVDEDRAVTKAYGLYHAFSHDAFRIAHPATLVIDTTGVVRYIYRGEDQYDRAPIAELLAAVKEVQA
jgi:peroxiredoxin